MGARHVFEDRRAEVRLRVGGGSLEDLFAEAGREWAELPGILVRGPLHAELAEEAPQAHKDVDRVADVVVRAGIARKVARLRPLGVLER
jgi:tRNA-splicing ligase RtcB